MIEWNIFWWCLEKILVSGSSFFLSLNLNLNLMNPIQIYEKINVVEEEMVQPQSRSKIWKITQILCIYQFKKKALWVSNAAIIDP